MKSLIPILLLLSGTVSAQFVHKIKADSVLLTYDECTTELIIENGTRNVKGFLYNKGNGKTEFRRIYKLNDSTIVAGEDTISMRGIGNDWSIFGNENSDTTTDFVGTTDARGLAIKTDALERIRITAAGNMILGKPLVDNGNKIQVAGNYAQSGNRLEFNNSVLGGSGSLMKFISNGTRYMRVSQSPVITIMGAQAGGLASDGFINTAMGYHCMRDLQSSAFNNSAFGVNSLRGLTTGNHNTAMSINTATFLTTGIRNTIFGGTACFVLSTEHSNSVLGSFAMLGLSATDGPTSGPKGSENIMIGFNAGGSGKTYGFWSSVPTTYTGNIMVGHKNGKTTAGGTLSNTTLLGNTINTDLSNVVVLGGSNQTIGLSIANNESFDSIIKLQINSTTGYQGLQLRQSYTPSSSVDTNGATGVIAWDEDYVYVKTAAGWKRAAISTF